MTNVPNMHYSQLQNGIHRFDVFDDSPSSIDALFDKLYEITDASDMETVNRYLLVASIDGRINISQTIKRANEFFRRNQRRPYSRTAVVHRGGLVIQMVYQYIQGMNKHDAVQFFSENQLDQAEQWLLSSDR